MDVARYFGLAQVPFRATIAPEEAWFRGPFANAVTSVLSRLRAGDQVIAIVAPAGSGKSLALRTIAKRLKDAGKIAHHVGHTDQLADELPADGVLLVDEADASDPDALRRLRDDAAGRNLQLVLAGEGGFVTKLGDASGVQAVRLPPLSAAEAHDFLLDRLSRCGRPDLFEPAAFERVLAFGGGAPRRIGTIAGAALLEAALDGAGTVTAEHVERAQAMRATLSGRRAIEPVAEAGATAIAARRSPFEAGLTAVVGRLRAAQDGRLGALIALVIGLAALPLVASVREPQPDPPGIDAAGEGLPAQARGGSTAAPSEPVSSKPDPAAPPARSAVRGPEEQVASAPRPLAAPAPVLPSPKPRPETAEVPTPQRPAADRLAIARVPNPPTARQELPRVRTAPVSAPAAERPADPPVQVATIGASSIDPAPSSAEADFLPSTPASAPTAVRSGPVAKASSCACPEGMSAARCNEWKAWRCRSKD